MEQFRKWQEKRAVKTIGYLNNSSAYNTGEENGWRAALEEILSQLKRPIYSADIMKWIEQELGDT